MFLLVADILNGDSVAELALPLCLPIFFLAIDFRFCVVIRFFHPRHNGQMTSNFEGFSIPDFIHYIYILILILEKEPVFSLLNVQC